MRYFKWTDIFKQSDGIGIYYTCQICGSEGLEGIGRASVSTHLSQAHEITSWGRYEQRVLR